jgi:hypothetical protein
MREPLFGMSRRPMPSTCPDCGSRMGPVGHREDGGFRRHCPCGCVVDWAFPNVFVRRHELPLWDRDRRILGRA